ncbi:MAG TPA: lactate utilization protein [Actinospica sp.]|nr:lactate utilization protein [Actinospica sp.]
MTGGARDEILGRVRRALEGAPASAPEISRDYLDAHTDEDLIDLLADNLTDYRAHVHRVGDVAEMPALVAGLLDGPHPRLVVPEGVPSRWLPEKGIEVLDDRGPLTPAELDAADAVLTSCALAIAETGTIVLDAGSGQGRRVLTLIPDHHICVVPSAGHVVASLPRALGRLDPSRPLTWIAGPSATSDIELDRVEGVHGPRRLDVILLTETTESSGRVNSG